MGRRRDSRSSGEAAASVSTKQSMVAMLGWIMPTPLATPLMVTGTADPPGPGRSTVTAAALARESVVRRASAMAAKAASSARSSPATTAPMAASTRSTGRRLPMRPVDMASTWLASVPTAAARRRRQAALVGQAGLSGGRVGAAARGHHGLGPAAAARPGGVRGGQVLPVQADRGGRQAVRGEGGGHGRRGAVHDDDGQVQPAGGLDAGPAWRRPGSRPAAAPPATPAGRSGTEPSMAVTGPAPAAAGRRSPAGRRRG